MRLRRTSHNENPFPEDVKGTICGLRARLVVWSPGDRKGQYRSNKPPQNGGPSVGIGGAERGEGVFDRSCPPVDTSYLSGIDPCSREGTSPSSTQRHGDVLRRVDGLVICRDKPTLLRKPFLTPYWQFVPGVQFLAIAHSAFGHDRYQTHIYQWH
jgi:hypothetical protein